ncbi:MAG TPA: hypothetical protein VLI55_15220 [Bryobacteraceae bacterium]|nr:hypothetical protein [Bryobacteraceae bacterium]
MAHTKKSEISSHTPGTNRGEEMRQSKGPEPGREHGGRTARDSTSIGPKSKGPIDPRMPNMPPA